MMKLSEIFEQLTTGELSQVAIGGNEQGGIDEANYRAVANHVKLGLTTLYNRFDLKRSEVDVLLMPDQYVYPLQSKYALNGKNSTEPKRWIMDTPLSPFGEDILKILVVKGDTGEEFPLNDYTNEYSVHTPTMDSIRVPVEVVTPTDRTPVWYRTTQLMLCYQANHPNFLPRVGYFDPELTNIELPLTHLQALLYFVASRVHNPIGMGQEFNAGNNWAQRFEAECQRLEQEGREIDSTAGNTRAERGGWC
jgi:hypothetical protein